jgi:hypothetical protein
LTLEVGGGTKLDMIADSGFVSLLRDFDNAVVDRDPSDRLADVCRGLRAHPHYVRAFEDMLEREPDRVRRRLLERLLVEYEFQSIFELLSDIGRG